MKTYKIKQDGNHLDLQGADRPIYYDISGIELSPLTDYSFAVWHLLPAAMKCGGDDIFIDGPVDPVVIANAQEFSRVWELWEPTKFRQVTIKAAEEVIPQDKPRSGKLVCFSGGVDSTHMLLRLGKQKEPGTTLTIHGMDIKSENIRQFEELARWTDPLLKSLNYNRVFVRTNVTEIGGGYHSWALTLTGCSFLFRHLFEGGIFAADSTESEDFLIFPWGCNHVTNKLMAGTDYQLESICVDASRVDKMKLIGNNPLALKTLSFCKQKKLRPRNCGTCNKCVRTKILMAASLATIPDIFIDPTFNRKMIRSFDISSVGEQAFLITAYQTALANGTLSAAPGLAERFEAIRNPFPKKLLRLLFGKK